MINPNIDKAPELAKDLADLHDRSKRLAVIVPGFRYMVGIGNRSLTVADFNILAGLGPVYSEFGIQKYSLKTGNPLARCGFNIDEAASQIFVDNTPQGVARELMNSNDRNTLVRSDFRRELLELVVDTARSMGIGEVTGRSARGYIHESGKRANLTYDQAHHVMDEQFEKLGFKIDYKGKTFKLKI